jgi:hypothetical protein
LETKSRGRLLVRRILEYPPSITHAQIAAEVGLGRETVRRVRFGERWADEAPEMLRMEPDQAGRLCHQCVHWDSRDQTKQHMQLGRCGLGIPEPLLEGLAWARGCGAFTRKQAQSVSTGKAPVQPRSESRNRSSC